MKNKNGRRRRTEAKDQINEASCSSVSAMMYKYGRRWRIKLARKKAIAADAADSLSKLPNGLLLNILERVDTLDAIRTCILSKRLLKLPTMLSNLLISAASIADHHKGPHEFGINDILRISHDVAGITDSILSTRSPEITISKLYIRFVLTDHDTMSIGTSVSRAMATQKVDAAEFEIVTKTPYVYCSIDDLLHFASLFNTLLGGCPDAFAGLTRLLLRNLRFDELGIPELLSACKRLESLHLTSCDSGISSVVRLEHAQLVELELSELRHRQNWRQLVANVPSIRDLHLDFECEKIWVWRECPKLLAPVLRKLQQVNLENIPEGCDFSWTLFFLEAAPFLKELCITVWDHWCIMATDKEFRKEHSYCQKAEVKWKPSAPGLKHKNLLKLTIYGFQPEDYFVRYIRLVAEAAVNMSEISLHDRKVCGRCGDLDPKIKVCPSRYPRTAEERKRTLEELGLAAPSVVHFRS